MKVYIVFGDVPRSDGDNIQGIFTSKLKAEEYIDSIKNMYIGYLNIEEHDVDN
jgi:hypothetical protein